MALEVHVVPHVGPLPHIAWQRDLETGILAGSFIVPPNDDAFTGSVELTDEDGSIVVLDVVSGVVCGLDVVMWPELVELPGLAAPVEAREGQVLVPSRAARRGATVLEFDAALAASTDPAARTIHLRFGARRAVEPIRVADRMLLEVDAAGRLAGVWLQDLPDDSGTD